MPTYDRYDMENAIDRYVINSRYRAVLRLRYCEGLTYDQIADETHYSVQHVKHICKTYKPLLFSYL